MGGLDPRAEMSLDARRFILGQHLHHVARRMCRKCGCIWPTRRMICGTGPKRSWRELGLPPPFWAFAWAGGQGLARYVLDNPQMCARQESPGLRLRLRPCRHCRQDGGGGGGDMCADIDPFAGEAARLNAALNGVSLKTVQADLIGREPRADLLLGGRCVLRPADGRPV